MLLLDTHAWVWIVEGDTRRIGRRSRRLITQAAAREAIRISPASLFELTALHTAGRLQLARPPEQWIRDYLDVAGVRLAELSAAMAVDAGMIPTAALADPLDRLLVATARQLSATLLTADIGILQYASTAGRVRAHDART